MGNNKKPTFIIIEDSITVIKLIDLALKNILSRQVIWY
jgi:hypothetical protein